MKDNIQSANTAEVAKLPFNLQFFSEDAGGENETFDESEVEEVEEQQDNDEPETGENDSEPADQKPERDLEKDRAFAELRRKAEEAERKAQALEVQRQKDLDVARKYGERYGVYSVDDIAKVYGASYGITTLEQFEQALQREEYKKAGLPPELADELAEIRRERAERQQEKEQQEQARYEAMLFSEYETLAKEYPQLVKDPNDVQGEVWKKWNDGKSGISLTEAYELVNKTTIREQIAKSAQQAKLNQMNSKKHIRSNGGEGGDDLDTTSVPNDTMDMYRKMFAKELRTGKMTESDLIKHYKKSVKG